ncbi:cytochrome c oxidase subunit 3, partial [Mycobacterium tuberculosis]|nr:cytochrome c oxidase subunit 3 [Mycobacterium tuberculosis]
MAEGHAKHHDYHLVDPSPWPLTISIGAFVMAVGAVGLMRWLRGEEVYLLYMKISNPWLILVGLAIVLYTFFAWWRDVIREGHEG